MHEYPRRDLMPTLKEQEGEALGWGHFLNKGPRPRNVPQLWTLPIMIHKAKCYHEPYPYIYYEVQHGKGTSTFPLSAKDPTLICWHNFTPLLKE